MRQSSPRSRQGLALGLVLLASGAACRGKNPAYWAAAPDGTADGASGHNGDRRPDEDGPAGDTAAFDLGTGLIGQWSFEEPAGTRVVQDLSGHGHHGTLENLDPATARVPAKLGRGVAFPASASNPGVRVERTAVVDGLTAFTAAAWILRSNDATTEMSIISRQLGTGSRQVFNLGLEDNLPLVVLSSADGAAFLVRAATPLLRDEWTHVAATFNGVDLRLYVRGKEVAWGQRAFSMSADPGTPLYLGTNKNSGADEPLTGVIDEVLLYSVPLPAAAIAALARGAVPPAR